MNKNVDTKINTEGTNAPMPEPTTVTIENFKRNLVELINNSKLHPFILDAILKDVFNEVHMMYQRQVENERKEYEESIASPKEA